MGWVEEMDPYVCTRFSTLVEFLELFLDVRGRLIVRIDAYQHIRRQ